LQRFVQQRYNLSFGFEEKQMKFKSSFESSPNSTEKWVIKELFWLLEGNDSKEEDEVIILKIKKKLSSLWGIHFQEECTSSSENHCSKFLRSLSQKLLPVAEVASAEVLFLTIKLNFKG
jgi:hypothetical protein